MLIEKKYIVRTDQTIHNDIYGLTRNGKTARHVYGNYVKRD